MMSVYWRFALDWDGIQTPQGMVHLYAPTDDGIIGEDNAGDHEIVATDILAARVERHSTPEVRRTYWSGEPVYLVEHAHSVIAEWDDPSDTIVGFLRERANGDGWRVVNMHTELRFRVDAVRAALLKAGVTEWCIEGYTPSELSAYAQGFLRQPWHGRDEDFLPVSLAGNRLIWLLGHMRKTGGEA